MQDCNELTYSRRTFLRGVGTAMALPLLEAMMPLTALAQSAQGPPDPHGVHVRAERHPHASLDAGDRGRWLRAALDSGAACKTCATRHGADGLTQHNAGRWATAAATMPAPPPPG